MSDVSPAPTRDSVISLREVTADTVRAVCGLKVRPDQERFVATNAVSIAQAHFNQNAWFRAIYADETPVGFVMVEVDSEKQEYFLWRYMIDGRYQRMGFGRRALLEVIQYIRTRPGATEFFTSYVPGEGSPREFYAGVGFEETGEVDDGENVMRLLL